MGKELGLERALDQWISFLRRAYAQRKPVILKSRQANKFDGAEWYCPFG